MENEEKTVETGEDKDFDALDPKTQKYIRELRKENEKYRKTSTDTSSKLAALEQSLKEREEKELAESNKHRELYELTKKEKSDLEKQYTETAEKLKHFEAVYEAERQELLGKLPEGTREKFENASKEQVQAVLSLMATTANSPGAKNTSSKEMDLDAMTWDEQMKLNADNPGLYAELKTKQFRKQREGL